MSAIQPNINLGNTIITDKIRVSTAAIFYDEWFGQRYQLETFIFSTDSRIGTRQIIHTSTGIQIPETETARISKIHEQIVKNLNKLYAIQRPTTQSRYKA